MRAPGVQCHAFHVTCLLIEGNSQGLGFLPHCIGGGGGGGCFLFSGGGGLNPNQDELSEHAGGTCGRLTLFNTVTYQETKSYCMATTQRHITSKRIGKETQHKLVCLCVCVCV